ncbi:MAG TPA: hypothetical protein VFS23_36500 [Vicinamibacterales bacterium]|nr:hypothetical protein [Vicinamibacterales bacterium]
MVDAVNFRGEFAAKSAEWGEQRMGKLNEVICDFVDAIRQVNLEVVVCSAEESALSPEGIAAKKRDVFEHVVRQLHDDMRAKHAPHVLMFICDREQDMVKPVVGWLDKLSIKDSVLAERIGGARKLNGSVTIQTNLAIRGLND